MKRGFTLIELLVVVLIIGVLSAIALPQYQVAVAKTRFATIKNLTHSLLQAEEIYFLANNSYTLKMEDLGVCEPNEDSPNRCYYDWGFCALYADNVQCNMTSVEMAYQVYMQMSRRMCIARNQDITSVQNKVCKSETGKNSYDSSWDTNYGWYY